MTVRQSRHEPLRVNLLGFMAKQLGDLRGPSSLAYELIQNADDAKDDSSKLSATRIEFDITDDALIVSNDAVFRDEDFDRIKVLASGTKLLEEGDRTTGAFGVGFISVYQITDEPQIYSAGQHLTIRPEEELKQIEICDLPCDHPSFAKDIGTKFYLPWAYESSSLRDILKTPPVTKESIEYFVKELEESLPRAILFLKRLKEIELRRKGEVVVQIRRTIEGDDFIVHCGDECNSWHTFRDSDGLSAFKNESKKVYDNRLTQVRVAIPEDFIDNGFLFATLPTKELTRLPFHIDADFFPASDRKSIRFDDVHDPMSEWNREVIRVAASLVSNNLNLLREMFSDNPIDFWAILESIYNLREVKHDAHIPLGVFWEVLKPVLETHPIVYTESNKWLKVTEVCTPVSREEWDTIDAFNFLDIEMVNRDLRRYYNILTNNGVRRLGIKDIYEALKEEEMIAHPQPISFYESYERLELLWRGILAIYHRTKGQQDEAKTLLGKCVLAPGVDGRIWPCNSVYQVEDKDTLKLFSRLLPNDRSFLDLDKVGEGDSLFELLCPSFSSAEAVKVLENLEPQEFRKKLSSEGFQPVDIVRWFSKRELDEDDALRERFVKLAIFPAGDGYVTSLEALWIPGGFDDPLGITQLLDMQKLKGLSAFLEKLGAKKLTFIDYAKRYITDAFDSISPVDLETKYKLFEMLERNFGKIREDEELRDQLINTDIVECIDGVFRSPGRVYFPYNEIEEVLGSHVSYCKLPARSEESRRDLYKWLGVAEHPRVEDILHVIDRLANDSPDHRTRKSVISCLIAVDKVWEDFSDNEREGLKNKRWLPAKNLSDRWYKPEELYTTEDKRLFESQACFIDAPIRLQSELRAVLNNLGIKSQPQPLQVARHLLKCSQDYIDPPKGIYEWLDKRVEEIPSPTLNDLRESACLSLGGKYRRPDQVFWQHDFGRFRSQLGDDMRYYSNLLRTLGVKEYPDHDDALKLLKDIAHQKRNDTLELEEKDAVFQCWVLISRALDYGNFNANEIKEYLQDIPCIPNVQEVLNKPSWMYFEDRPRLKDKFQELVNNCIQRTEGIWKGMEAAGVRPLSSAIRGDIDKEDIHINEDASMRDKFTRRRNLIATILEGFNYNKDSLIDNIRFFRANEIKITWKLDAFNRYRENISSESAFFDCKEEAIYYKALDPFPWSAIARELAYALAQGEKVTSISPGIMVVLEANTADEARMQLEDLGIALTQELALDPSSRTNGVAFDETLTDGATEAEDAMDDAGQEYSLGEDDGGGVANSDMSSSVSGVDNQDAPRGWGSTRLRPPPSSVSGVDNQDAPLAQDAPFAKKFYGLPQGTTPSGVVDHPVSFPHAGPQTEESAIEHTQISAQSGRTDNTTEDAGQEDGFGEDDSGDGVANSDMSSSVSGVDNQDAPFAKKFYGLPKRTTPSGVVDHPVSFPRAGPQTEESAIEHTQVSAQSGKSSGAYIERLSTKRKSTEATAELARDFRDMVYGDYGKRCQICGNTFSTTAGQLQVFVVHIVPPIEDHRTNHFGNLLGLCGWHYSLIQYNRHWEFLDIKNKHPFDSWEDMQDYVLEANPDVDDEGNSYFGLGIRFPNMYPQWSSEATTQDAVIRYSEPHWKYLRKLLVS